MKKTINKDYPLILVFYLDYDKDSTAERRMVQGFAESINQTLLEKEANAMAFFMPTKGPERVECINPLLATPDEKTRISEMIDMLQKQLGMGKINNVEEE